MIDDAYPEGYTEAEWLGLKRTEIPFLDGFVVDDGLY